MWDLIVSVPDHCLSFYFSHDVAHILKSKHPPIVKFYSSR